MRVLFLDFDGVLHPVSVLRWFEMHLPFETTVKRAGLFRWTWILADLLEPYPDVQIIVHSTWRQLRPDSELKIFLGPLGDRFFASTPQAQLQRWESIVSVVESNQLSDFRILDDHPSEFPARLDKLIVCDSELGVYDYVVRDQLCAWLHQKPR